MAYVKEQKRQCHWVEMRLLVEAIPQGTRVTGITGNKVLKWINVQRHLEFEAADVDRRVYLVSFRNGSLTVTSELCMELNSNVEDQCNKRHIYTPNTTILLPPSAHLPTSFRRSGEGLILHF